MCILFPDFYPFFIPFVSQQIPPRPDPFFEGEMAHAHFFEESVREQMPKCSYRKYTISEIINSVIDSGFTLRKFDEHPAWTNEKIPGEFTIVASKQ